MDPKVPLWNFWFHYGTFGKSGDPDLYVSEKELRTKIEPLLGVRSIRVQGVCLPFEVGTRQQPIIHSFFKCWLMIFATN